MTITRAVLYARVSTERQAAEGVSLDAQLDLARAHCEAKGWFLIGDYTDVMSGRDGSRPQLKRMMDDAERNAFEVVIVYKLDRLGRSTRKIFDLLGRLEDHDIKFKSLTQDLDSSTTQGKAMTALFSMVAEMESDHTSERVKSAMRQIVLGGKRFGGRVALGYDEVDGRYVINDVEAELVREAYAAYLRLRSFRSTCEHLNSHGYRSKTGRPFTVASIKVILKSPVYLGNTVWSRTEVVKSSKGRRCRKTDSSRWVVAEGTHPPLIEKDIWDAAQTLVNENATLHPRLIYGRGNAAWGGLIMCSQCGHLAARWNKKGYLCSMYMNSGKSSCPGARIVSDKYLNGYAIPRLSEALDAFTVGVSQAPAKKRPAEDGRRQNQSLRKIAELEVKREREKQLFRGGFCTFEEMAVAIRKIEDQIKELGDRPSVEILPPPIFPMKLSKMWASLAEPARVEFLRAIVDHCEAGREEFIFYLKPFDHPSWPDTIRLPKVSMRWYKEGE